MSKNILQVYQDNPIVTNQGTDLMYFGRAPYDVGDDTAMLFSSFAAQFGAPYTPSALTKVDDTNVTLTLGGTPATSLLQAVSLTMGWTGQLSPARGGTGVNNGTNTLTLAGNLATSGAFSSIFTMTGATNVTFPTSGTLATTSQLPTPAALTKVDDTNVTLTLGGTPATALLQATSLTLGWTGTLGVTRGGTGLGSFSQGDLIYANAANTLSALAKNTSATRYLSNTGTTNNPAWAQVDLSNGVTGILPVANGGTGLSAIPTVPTASTYAAWDANSNFFAINVSGGFATTVSAAGTTILTSGSSYNQEITGSTTQTIQLPVASTMVTGMSYKIMNNSSGAVTINSSGGNPVLVMAANTTALVTCVLNSGTTAASWNATYIFDAGGGVLSITGTANQVTASAATGAVTLSLPQSIATTSAVQFDRVSFSDTTHGVVGTTTNNDAASGYVGEFISSVITSPVSISTATATNLTSISLTAGDWDLEGHIHFIGALNTVVRSVNSWISTTSATLPGNEIVARQDYGSAGVSNVASGGVDFGVPAPAQRISLNGTTTVYLSGYSLFTTSTMTMIGFISARRRR